MILSDLKEYLQQRQVVSMEELMQNFNTDADTLREMLEVWIRKGKVRKVNNIERHCFNCPQCKMMAGEYYQWVNKQ